MHFSRVFMRTDGVWGQPLMLLFLVSLLLTACNSASSLSATSSPTAIPVAKVPSQIVVGSDGALWFLEQGTHRLGRITPQGKVTEFPVPTVHSIYDLDGITAGPDGALWFTDQNGDQQQGGNHIWRMTVQGKITSFSPPSAYSQPWGITAGPDGALWFTESETNKIGRITVQGKISEFALPAA